MTFSWGTAMRWPSTLCSKERNTKAARKCGCVSDEQGFHILLVFFPSLAKGTLTALIEIWLMSDVLLDRVADVLRIRYSGN